ncbi:MAG: hypothetical protein WB679_06810 [Terracidiphilus sp.]
MTKLSPLFRDWILVGISNATIPVIVIWKLQSGELNRTTAFVASWASFIGINLVFILASRRRDFKQGRPSRQGFILHVACLVVVMAVITTLSLYLVHSKNHYAALALSDVPLDSIEPERDRLVVELIRKRAIRSKEYAAAAAQFPPISPPLYSAASFTDVNTMNSTAAQLKRAFDVDQAYGAQMKGDMDSFRSRMATVDPAYLQSWMTSDGPAEEAQSQLLATEDEWAKSVLSLYEFAVSHRKEISVHDGTISFSTPELKSSFEARETASKELQTRVQSGRDTALRIQQQAAQRTASN